MIVSITLDLSNNSEEDQEEEDTLESQSNSNAAVTRSGPSSCIPGSSTEGDPATTTNESDYLVITETEGTNNNPRSDCPVTLGIYNVQ